MHPVTPTQERGPQATTVEAEVNIRCTFCGPSSCLSASANLAFTYSGNRLQNLKDLVQEYVLPCWAYVRDVKFGSVTFVVIVTHLGALEEIWKRYKEGKMKHIFAEKIFKISAQDQPGLDLTIEISEDEYTKAKEQLTVPPNPDRKLDQIVRGQDNIQEGQSEIKNNQEAMQEQLSGIELGIDSSKDQSDRKLDQLVRGQDNIQEGQSEIKNNQEAILEKLSGIALTPPNSSKDQSGASADKVKETIAVQATDGNPKKLSPESKKETANTDQGRNPTKLSAEMPLKELWAKQGFRDEFSKEMNVKYNKTNAKHWPYLGEEFDVKGDKIDEIASCDDTSPSESMFQAMERKKPYLRIEELCDALRKAKAHKVLRIVEDAIKVESENNMSEGRIKPGDYISDMWDKDPDGIQQVILNLDKRGAWKRVAIELGFAKKDWQSFQRDMDPASNLTRDLFDILRTQRPQLRVEAFKEKLQSIEQEGVLKILEDNNISGGEILSKLSEMPGIMLDIEHILNDPQDSVSLWKLAESFQNDGFTIDVEMFRPRATEANPTYHLMEHIIACSPEEPTIQDLIIHLETIDRKDVCQGVIAEYVEVIYPDVLPNHPTNPNPTCKQKVDKERCPKMENLQASQEPKKQVSEQDNRDE